MRNRLSVYRSIALALPLLLAVPVQAADESDPSASGPVYRQSMTDKKIIVCGWDMPDTAYLREHYEAMQDNPLDGVILKVVGRPGENDLDHGVASTSIWSSEPWEREWFDRAREDLQAVTFDRLSDNFIRVAVTPGDLDWFDDAAWSVLAEKFGLMAELASDTGLKGLVFDPESYSGAQFAYPPDATEPFEAYEKIARQRGREVMQAIAEEYPGMTLFGFHLLGYSLHAANLPEDARARGLMGTYPLYLAFFNGMLDVLPPQMTLVEGAEDTYKGNSPEEFLLAYNVFKVHGQNLIAPENREKFRTQVQAGFGIFLDGYLKEQDNRWYIPGRPRVERLRQNLTTALAVSDQYVWLWGEDHHWWDAVAWPGVKARRSGLTWQEGMPGIEKAIAWARDPFAQAEEILDVLRARESSSHPNLLRNARFSTGPRQDRQQDAEGAGWSADGLPTSWNGWQKAGSDGRFTWDPRTGREQAGSAQALGVSHGCFLQTVPVKPGEQYVFEVYYRSEGNAFPDARIVWRDAYGDWMNYLSVSAVPAGPRDADGWQRAVAVVTVPDRASEIVLQLTAHGAGGEENQVWFDDIRLHRLTADLIWE